MSSLLMSEIRIYGGRPIRLVYDRILPPTYAGFWDSAQRVIGVPFGTEEAPFTLAHELAHARLGHAGTRQGEQDKRVAQEYAAWEYVRKHGWAFDAQRATSAMQTYLENVSPLKAAQVYEQMQLWTEEKFTHS